MDTIPKQTGPVICLFFICGRLILGQDPYVYFEKNWCRERTLRTDWRTYTHSCPSYSRHWAYEIWSDDFKTHPNLSFISGAEINPAGHFSKIYIQSVTVLNRTKAFGGDAWRVRVQGPADLVATVSDMENGTYEAKFLPMEPGTYSLQITLDYTLCHGLKNPPPDWFMRGLTMFHAFGRAVYNLFILIQFFGCIFQIFLILGQKGFLTYVVWFCSTLKMLTC